jgi:molybdopterin/thiamine biosynthesis adenylyltransferase
VFDQGVTEDNLQAFLEGVDIYVDGLDFFALRARRMVFSACERLGIPVVTAAPLGMGFSLLVFKPGGMGFERYFRFAGQTEPEQYARFIAGLSPAMLQRHYLAAPDAVDFAARRGPSTPMACDLCAGVTGTVVLKLLLGRGPVRVAPWALQFDSYLQRSRWTWRPMGNANPLQRALLRFIRPRLGLG